ncbi:THO complex subunit 4A, partial [Linum perenne]
EVVYARREDALTAIKRYNNVQLDGKPLHIELLGVNMLAVPPPVFLPPVNMIRPNHPFTRYTKFSHWSHINHYPWCP